MGRFKSMGERFQKEFDDVLKNAVLPEIENAAKEAYTYVESEVEDLIDSGRVKVSPDVTAKQVFKKMED